MRQLRRRVAKILGSVLIVVKPEQGVAKPRQILLHRTADTRAVDGRVAVNEDVPEGDDLTKVGNSGCELKIKPSKAAQRLAEDLELPLDRGAQDDVAIEIREGSCPLSSLK